jgi:hypothetical protein
VSLLGTVPRRLCLAAALALFGLGAGSCDSTGGSVAPGPSCGNGVVDGSEECDGEAFGEETCADLGFQGGTLGCEASCKLDSSSCCNDECEEGDSICQSNRVATCTRTAAGCKQWVTGNDCSASGMVCAPLGNTARCRSVSCADQCTELGATHCNGNQVESCTTDAEGCAKWKASVDCASVDKQCNDSSGQAGCVAGCPDPCTLGERRCDGNVVQACETVGTCPGWVSDLDCSERGESCLETEGRAGCISGCANKCIAEEVQTCLSDVVHTCTADEGGCLDWVATEDCKAAELSCKFASGGKAFCQGPCADPCTTVGELRCSSVLIQECKALPANCNAWQTITTCPSGQACADTGGTAECAAGTKTGEDCRTAWPISAGANSVAWTATKNDYLTPAPRCGTSQYGVKGPDLVLHYTAPFTGTVDFTIGKAAGQRVSVYVSTASCGNTANLVACASDQTGTTLGASFGVEQGITYFFYLAGTTSETSLPKPLNLQLTEIDCATFSARAVKLSPANGETTRSLLPKLVADFDTAVVTTAGEITVSGDKGTNLVYTLPSPAVAFTNSNKTLTVSPEITFPAGEQITVSWTGLTDARCKNPLAAANWTFTIASPPCAPGAGGLLGARFSRRSTALGSTTYNYLVADSRASGYLYIGNATTIERLSKVGTSLQSIISLAGLSSSIHIGYEMVVDADDIFTLKDRTSGEVGWVWRLSSDSGATWSVEDFATMPAKGPTAAPYSGAAYKGKLYALTRSTNSTTKTQIWSVPIGTPPNAAVLEREIAEQYCTGLAVDDGYYYMACGPSTNYRLIRVSRTTGTILTLASSQPFNTTRNFVVAQDTNADGSADYLYYKGASGDVFFVCNPASATRHVDTLVSYAAAGSSHYGLTLDAAQGVLFAWDGTARQLIKIE